MDDIVDINRVVVGYAVAESIISSSQRRTDSCELPLNKVNFTIFDSSLTKTHLVLFVGCAFVSTSITHLLNTSRKEEATNYINGCCYLV